MAFPDWTNLLKGKFLPPAPPPPTPAIIGEPINDAETMDFRITVLDMVDSPEVIVALWQKACKFSRDKGYTDLTLIAPTALMRGPATVCFFFQASR